MDNMTRIKRVSKGFRLVFTSLMLLIPIVDAVFWLFFNELSLSGILLVKADINEHLTSTTRLLLFVISLIPTLVLTYGAYIMVQLFQLYEQAVVFSSNNVKQYRSLGYVILFWVLAIFISVPLNSLALSYDKPPGERYITVGFDLIDVFTIVIGAIIILISWIMEEGRKLEDEQAYVV